MNNNSGKENKIKAFQKILGEPVFLGFDTKTEKIRNKLLLISVISIISSLANLSIKENSSLFGLQFEGLNNDLLGCIFLCVLVYFFINFSWNASNCFMEWRLRVTGTKRNSIVTPTFAGIGSDYPDDPRQSTLYHWWKIQSLSIKSTDEKFHFMTERFNEIKTEIEKEKSKGEFSNIFRSITPKLDKISSEIREFHTITNQLNTVLQDGRIMTSLHRFDNWFIYFCKSQNWRWFLIDLLLPIFLGLWAIITLLAYRTVLIEIAI